jgi:hypothetical protein
MTRPIRFYSFVLGLGLALTFASGQAQNPHKLRLLLSEIQVGSSYTDQYCPLVFVDHRFHSEKTNRRRGQDTDRWTYEGELSETEWNTLVGFIDSKELRDNKYQNMEFLDSKSLKPYQSQIKPLLQWWKSLRGRHRAESHTPLDDRCSLDSTHVVFSQ